MDFEPKEIEIIKSRDLCRISTNGSDGWPHSVPVSYLLLNNNFYIPSHPDSTKIRNLKRDPKCTIVIDDEKKDCGIMLKCESKILEAIKCLGLKKIMREAHGWENDESTEVIELIPLKKAIWFL